jgi:guanylate kinase
MSKPSQSGSLVPTGKPLLIVLSGPSGVGKDAVLNHLRKVDSRFGFITTMTTRARRPNEKDNRDYHFVSKEEFMQLVAKNELLESANVYGNWYGVSKQTIREALQHDKDILWKVDVQGAATIKKLVPQAVFIFLMPPSIEELDNRLRMRYTESPETLALRLKTADSEIKQVSKFDYLVVNHCDQLELAAAEIQAIAIAEKCRTKPREIIIP